jgi:IclR family pca regulon transcriptional regulator
VARSTCSSAHRPSATRSEPRSRLRRVRYKNRTPDPPDSRPPRNADYVQSLERGLSVIRAFDGEHRELGLSEVARATGLTRAAARRFLLTLVALGYMHFDGSRFSLRPRVLELGFAYLSSLSLPELAEPHMEALVARLNESSSISVLDDTDVVYVARVPTRRIMSITIAVGTRLPAFATSMGRVLLAALPDAELEERLARVDVRPFTPRTVKSHAELRKVLDQVRRQGYAVTDQELEQGLRSAAVPIHDASGTVVAALNVSVHASRASMHELRSRFLPPAREAAAAIDAEVRKSGLRATGGSAVGRAGLER